MSDIRRDYFTQAVQDIATQARFDAVKEAANRGQFIDRIDVTITIIPTSGDPITCTSSTPGT